MKITVEISYYPLSSDYGNKVLDFLSILKNQQGIKVRSNSMSTQISGEITDVMSAITSTMSEAWSSGIKAPVIMKCFNEELDLSWLPD